MAVVGRHAGCPNLVMDGHFANYGGNFPSHGNFVHPLVVVNTSESIKWHSLLHVEENRRERRYAATEAVAIVLQPGFGDVSPSIRGRFVDRSHSGCRIRHSLGDLRVGDEVLVVWRETNIRARVVWNKTVGNATETGFQFLSKPAE